MNTTNVNFFIKTQRTEFKPANLKFETIEKNLEYKRSDLKKHRFFFWLKKK